MLSKTRTARQYDIPGVSLRGPYKVWLPNATKTADSDGEREQRTRSSDRIPTTAPTRPPPYQPEPAPAQRPPPQPIPRASHSTTAATTPSSSQQWYWTSGQSAHAAPGQQPSNSSLSSAGSQKYSTPATSLSGSGSYQQSTIKNPRIDPSDLPVRPSSSWRSSGDRSIDERGEDERQRKSKRPSTGESTSSVASTGSASAARDTEPRRSDVASPARGDPTAYWFNDRQPTQGPAVPVTAGRATGPTDIFIPSEVQHARQNSFEKQARREDPRKPNGYLSDVTETDERTPKMLSRSPPAPVVFPMYPPDRSSKTSLLQAAVPARGISPVNVPMRGISPLNVPPRGVSPSTASRYDQRSRTNSQNDPSGLRSPYGWARQQAAQPSSAFSNALPADDEVVVQKLQRTKSATGTAPYPLVQPYAQAGKAEPVAIPTRRTTLPGPASRDSHSSSQSSLQFLAPSLHGSSTAVNNINGSKTSLAASFSQLSAHLPRVPSNSAVPQAASVFPPLAHLRSPSQTALPPSSITSPASTRPPTVQPSSYARMQTSYMPAPSTANGVLSPSAASARHLAPATPYRSAFTALPATQATSYSHIPSQTVANGSVYTQVHVHAPAPRSAGQTPYRGATVLPSSQFNAALRETSHFPPAQLVNAALPPPRIQSPPHRVQSPPHRAQSPPQRVQSPPHRVSSPAQRIQSPVQRVQSPQPFNEKQDSTSDEALPTPAAARSANSHATAPAPAPETKKRGSGGFLNFLRPKRYEFWQPPTDPEKERLPKKELEPKTRSEKQLPKEPAKLSKSRDQPTSSHREPGSLSSSRENISTSSHREPASASSHHRPTASSHGHSRQSSTTSVRMEVRIHDPTATTSRTTAMAMSMETSSATILPPSAAVAIPGSGRKSPKMQFKLFQKKRTRTVSSASLEALDGNTVNTMMNSPASSIRSPTPGASPPQRDPRLATLHWRDTEEAELVHSGRRRRRRPGVTFDIALEDSPMAGSRPRPSRARTATPRSTPRPLPASTLADEDDEESDDTEDDDDE